MCHLSSRHVLRSSSQTSQACGLAIGIPLRVYTVPFSSNVYSINVHLLAFIVLCYPHAFASDPDVAVDIRKGSPTYGKHVAVELTEDNHRQFFIPKGFAHGFAVLSETAVFQYKCDNFYHPEADGGISILDDSLGIDWRIPTEHANLSEKDTKHKVLKDFDSPFEY